MEFPSHTGKWIVVCLTVDCQSEFWVDVVVGLVVTMEMYSHFCLYWTLCGVYTFMIIYVYEYVEYQYIHWWFDGYFICYILLYAKGTCKNLLRGCRDHGRCRYERCTFKSKCLYRKQFLSTKFDISPSYSCVSGFYDEHPSRSPFRKGCL